MNIEKAASILDIRYPIVSLLNQSRSQEEAERHVNAFKSDARKQMRRLAKIHHPDVNGDIECMKKIADAYNFVKNLKIRIRPPQVREVIVVNFGSTNFTNANSTVTTAYYTSFS